MSDPVLSVEGLTVTTRGLRLLDGVSFELTRGARLGIIGESGSGKTITALSILGLLPEGLDAAGRVEFDGRNLLDEPEDRMCALRGNGISMIFQEPMSALNPVMRVGAQVAEALRIHQGLDGSGARERVVELFDHVGIDDPERRVRSYPHQLSGGQRQRAMIAMALACGPEVVIADEPTTALDVTIQAQVLRVLHRQVDELRTALILITHDLPVVAGICDDVVVMANGAIVERGPTRRVFDEPTEAYTRSLVDAVPPMSRSTAITTAPRSPAPPPSRDPMVEVSSVVKSYRMPRQSMREPARHLRAVDEVSIRISRGETFGIVGESGSGKTTLARMLVGLERPDAGRIVVDGFDLAARNLAPLHRTAQMVFQDPMGSLDPRLLVGRVVSEPLRSLGIAGDHRARVRELLEAVSLPPDAVDRYPHEFSGGQRQRIAIARALAPHPGLLVADEPVSALDMSVQTRTLDLLAELKRTFALTMVFISHDLSVVHEICDRVAVMQRGRIVETGPVDEVFARPRHDYTKSLIASIPRLDGTRPGTTPA
jgi:peptide/nickel transport system ATP-binding protein